MTPSLQISDFQMLYFQYSQKNIKETHKFAVQRILIFKISVQGDSRRIKHFKKCTHKPDMHRDTKYATTWFINPVSNRKSMDRIPLNGPAYLQEIDLW